MMTSNLKVDVVIDDNILAGCIEGNRAAQELLYNFFAPKMFGICLRYSYDYHSAEDLLQDGFVKAFHNLDRFRGDGSFEGWLKRIFINTAIEQYRKNQNKQVNELNDEVYQSATSHDDVLDKLAVDDLLKVIQLLPPGYRTVFNLYVIEGYSHKEIATLLNISDGTSKSQLARAKDYIQNLLRKIK